MTNSLTGNSSTRKNIGIVCRNSKIITAVKFVFRKEKLNIGCRRFLKRKVHLFCRCVSKFAVKFEVKFIPNPANSLCRSGFKFAAFKSTASKPLVAHLSSPSAKPLRFENRFFNRIAQKPRKTIGFPGLFLTLMPFRLHCRGYRRAQNAERNIIILRKALLTNKKDAL